MSSCDFCASQRSHYALERPCCGARWVQANRREWGEERAAEVLQSLSRNRSNEYGAELTRLSEASTAKE